MFELESDEARLLLNIALMAIGKNRFNSASKILAALEAFRPDQPSVAVAKAVGLMSATRYDEAVAYIDGEALVKFPSSAMLKVFKGMALQQLKRDAEAEQPLREAIAQNDDEAAVNLARGLLNE